MKKRIYLIILALIVLLLCSSLVPLATALAERVQTAPAVFNATSIVSASISLVGTAIGIALIWLANKFLFPMLKVPIVGTLAKWAVDFAEQQLGNGNGEAKYDLATAYVMKVLSRLHVQVDVEQIRAAIVSAWTALNLDQIATGVKTNEYHGNTTQK